MRVSFFNANMIRTSTKHTDFAIRHLEPRLFLYFLFLIKHRRSNRLNQKLLWMRRKRICVYSRKLVYVRVKVRGAWREQRWRESAGNRAVSMLFPWKLSTSSGPAGLSGRFSTSRSATRYGVRKKKEKESELSDFNSERKSNREIGSLFWDKQVKKYRMM